MSDKTKPEPKWVSPEDACAIGGFGMTRCYEMMNDGTLISKKLWVLADSSMWTPSIPPANSSARARRNTRGKL